MDMTGSWRYVSPTGVARDRPRMRNMASHIPPNDIDTAWSLRMPGPKSALMPFGISESSLKFTYASLEQTLNGMFTQTKVFAEMPLAGHLRFTPFPLTLMFIRSFQDRVGVEYRLERFQ